VLGFNFRGDALRDPFDPRTAWKWGFEESMITLKRGDCENCGRFYRYSLWNSGFGNNTYAYCDLCGMLAVLYYSNPLVAGLPPASVECEEMDQSWEPFLLSCPCGGRFRRGASPRCPFCRERLSPTYAAEHIKTQALGAGRAWQWQNSWSGLHCMAIENPRNPGALLQIEDPVGKPDIGSVKRRWWVPFRLGSQESKHLRETATAKQV
jgi:hypothetical protein